MKIIKNISQASRGVPGVGEVKPGQSVVVDDYIGNSCVGCPAVWEVTGITEVKETEKKSIKASIREKLNIRKPDSGDDDLLEDLENGGD